MPAATGEPLRADSRPEWDAQIRRFRLREVNSVSVLDTLRGLEMLVPVLPGVPAERYAVRIAAPRPGRALPVFSTRRRLLAWNPRFRGVEADGPGIALAAEGAHTGYVLIDPGTPTGFSLRPRMLAALADGIPWTPPWHDSRLREAIREATELSPSVIDVSLEPGDPDGRLEGPEVLVRLQVLVGEDAARLTAMRREFERVWANDPRIAERVDSLGVRLQPHRVC